MNPVESLRKFLTNLGCRHRGEWYILDEFSSEFYLAFDCTDDPEQPDQAGTCDIYVCHIGASIRESEDRLRVLCNLRRHQVMRFMFALGVEQFSEKTRKFLYASNSVIRAE